ncbi:MAG: NBR1-Ig-like domain-containing protein [Ardenticatenaceae bacterium]|nr:NBR1-Ig-like domain-containing protein [Ardenticatenaceae bacterium]
MSKITAFNKIGFHAGPAGNHTGIGNYYKKLDAAGIPFVIKSVDHYGHIFEATQYKNAPHVYCFRLSRAGQPDDYDYDVPDYFINPEKAALKHWKNMEKTLPPEFNRHQVWIEPINEVDKGRSEWLGRFGVEFGKIALKEDIKVMMYAWSSGEPEPAHWELPGSLEYLEMCAEHHDQLGIALHEYSYVRNDIWRLEGDLVGRFVNLFDTCDRHNIKRPRVIISEWGWTYRRNPDPGVAMTHIEEVNRLYARYPEIMGAAIWYLGGGGEWANICNQTQKLIEPVTRFSLEWRFEVEPNLPEPVTPPPTGGPIIEEIRTPPVVSSRPPTPAEPPPPPPTQTSNAMFVADVSIPDDTLITPGISFTKTWRLKNTGKSTWNDQYKLVFIGGDPMGDKMAVNVPSARPGQIVEVSIPMRAPLDKEGTVYGDWRMMAPEGHQFGDIFYVRITVDTPPPAEGVNSAAFIADVNIPDDTKIESGESFTKTWRVKNDGDVAWTGRYKLTFVGGAAMADQHSTPLPVINPGQEVEISINMKAPVVPGVHWADFRPQDERGVFFGDILYVRIHVPEPQGTQGRIAPLSQNDPRWKGIRLGDSNSDQTIGEWGCLLTCLTMTANALGKNLLPAGLNDRMVRKSLFFDHKVTPWNTLSRLYSDIIYDGRMVAKSNPNITDFIDNSLKAGHPVAVQVDYTPKSPYTPNDQHWVLVVGRQGDDYRVNDPWIFPSVETSLRMRYGRPGKLLRDSIISAVFYRSNKPQEGLPVAGAGVLTAAAAPPEGLPVVHQVQPGMNIDPILPNSNPHNEQTFKGMDWVRFTYKVDGQSDPAQRNLRAAFGVYDETVRDFHRMGTGSIIVLNQETVWANAPWTNNHLGWDHFSDQFAQISGQIAAHYKRYQDKLAFELWHKQDLPDSENGVFIPPEEYGKLLVKTAAAVRAAVPNAKILSGGVVSGDQTAVNYLQQAAQAAGGQLPIDAIAVQPYGRWGTRAPFDWAEIFGPISDFIGPFAEAFPNLPLWTTEIGVPNRDPIDPVFYGEISGYMLDLYNHINNRHVQQMPVVIWYAWSDLMNHAGVVEVGGQPKPRIHPAFRKIRNKEWKGTGIDMPESAPAPKKRRLPGGRGRVM